MLPSVRLDLLFPNAVSGAHREGRHAKERVVLELVGAEPAFRAELVRPVEVRGVVEERPLPNLKHGLEVWLALAYTVVSRTSRRVQQKRERSRDREEKDLHLPERDGPGCCRLAA